MKIDGACHCGNITYTAEIDPENVGICHCTDCQTLSGSAFRTSVRADKEGFHLEGRQPKIYVKSRRKRRQTRPSVLSRVRHFDLFGSRNRSSDFQHSRGHRAPASRATAKVTRLVPVRARLGYGSAVHKTVSQATEQLGRAGK